MTVKLPETMTAIQITEYGEADVLKPGTLTVPELKSNDVLVKVAAAGVNRPDVFQRQGNYPPPPFASEIPGLEIAGTIAAVDEEVTDWNVGDTVCALVTGGGYAEYCVAPAPQCLPVPEGLNLVEAAALPETFFTVWSNVFDRAGLKAGEDFLVHGGSSGIGTAAIQMAKAFGARVFTTAGSREKCAACERLGADRAINYRTEDFVEVVKEKTAGSGVHVVLDMVGGDYVERNINVLSTDGHLVSIAFLKGPKVEINLLPLMIKRLTLTGSTLRPRSVEFKASIAKNLKEKIWPLISCGQIKPVIHKAFPFAEAAEAHRLMESSTHIGKLILEVE